MNRVSKSACLRVQGFRRRSDWRKPTKNHWLMWWTCTIELLRFPETQLDQHSGEEWNANPKTCIAHRPTKHQRSVSFFLWLLLFEFVAPCFIGIHGSIPFAPAIGWQWIGSMLTAMWFEHAACMEEENVFVPSPWVWLAFWCSLVWLEHDLKAESRRCAATRRASKQKILALQHNYIGRATRRRSEQQTQWSIRNAEAPKLQRKT